MYSTVPLKEFQKKRPRVTNSKLHRAYLVKIYPAVISDSLIPLDRDEIVFGRDEICDFDVADEFASRRHVAFRWQRKECFITDLESTNGTFVNDERISHRKLEHGDQIHFGTQIFKFLSAEDVEATYHEAVFQMMTVDALTQTYNRRYFEDVFERETTRAIRYQRSLGLLILDLDHFKKLNDTYGHLVGDQVLKGVCQRISSRLRHDDIFARIGGEEFAVTFIEGTKQTVDLVGHELCELVNSSPIQTSRGEVKVTISVGGAFASGDDPAECLQLFESADANLYRAKAEGRNQYAG